MRYLGGGACELWGSAVPEVPIRKYVDYTGDIDIRVAPPSFKITDTELIAALERDGLESDVSSMKPILLNEEGFTAYGDALTRWLYDQVVSNVRAIAPQFDRKGLAPPDYREDHETAVSDLQTAVGNLLVCRSPLLDRGMIKIQLTAKVGDEMNHIMEFILRPIGAFSIRNHFKVEGVYLEDPKRLLQGQLEGLVGRGEGILNSMKNRSELTRVENYPSFYKFDNHCARLLYLAALQKSLEGKPFSGSAKKMDFISKSDAVSILSKIYAAGANKMCYKHFGDNYMDRLIAIFETMRYIGPGLLSAKLNVGSKGVLNRAKAKGNAKAVGGRTRKRTRR